MPPADLMWRINLASVFAVLYLPAWIALHLRHAGLSIPVGGLMFWAWLVLTGDLMCQAGPSYNGMGVAFSLLFGLPFGVGYSTFWFLIGKLRKPRRHGRLSHAVSAVCWLLVATVCICFPFIVSLKSNRSVASDLPYTLPAVVPLLVLCLAMIGASLVEWVRLGRERRE